MRRRLIVECGAAQTRFALVKGGHVMGFCFAPARGDEALPRPPQSGDVYLGRVRTVSKALHAAFIDIGCGADGFMPMKKSAPTLVEGAGLIVQARRPALGAKGALLSAEWRRGALVDPESIEDRAARAAAPARLDDPPDAALEFFRAHALSDVDEIAVDNVDAAAPIRRLLARHDANPALSIEASAFERSGAAEALDRALERIVPLAGGARLIVDEAEGATIVDVDAGALSGAGAARLNRETNLAAAARLFIEISRRGIGGKVVVDFLPPGTAKERKELLAALDGARRGAFAGRFGKLSEDGLFDFSGPREAASLLEIATEEAGAGWVRPGRRFTLDWTAKAAIGALETRLKAAPSARVRLIAGGALAAYLEGRPQWAERLAARFGARFAIEADDRMEERAFDVAR